MPAKGGGDKGKLWVISQGEVQGQSSTEAESVCLLSPQLSFSPLLSLEEPSVTSSGTCPDY